MSSASIGTRVVEAIAAQDRSALEDCFAPGASLRALIPKGLRERAGAGEVAELVSGWLADAEPLELLDSTVDFVGDRLHLAYRLRGVENDRPFVVEQHWYCEVGEQGVERVDLVCSGLRPPG